MKTLPMSFSSCMKSRRAVTLLLAIFFLPIFFETESFSLRAEPVDATTTAEQPLSVVRVNATDQPWDFFHPWSKHAPYSRQALGAVLPGNKVLVTAELVANANYVELEKAESGEKVAATVDVVDYEANLALLKPNDAAFLKGIKPLDTGDALVGDRVAVWQLETTGALLITDALLTTVEVTRYPIDDTSLLIYRLTSSLQYREGSFSVPIVKNGKLIALLMRYDTRSQNVDAIPAPVIEHFLNDAASAANASNAETVTNETAAEYGGFPRAGMAFAALRDPQLRRYVGLNGGNANGTSGGVYITDTQKNSPAEKAGLREGDVLLAIGDKPIDQDGNYVDPRYGKLSLVNLISLKRNGEKVPFKIFRDGKTSQVEVTLAHRAASDYVIEPYTIDRQPRFYVLGGVVLQELSRQFLKEWGADWQKKAPERFVYLDRYQSELFSDEDENSHRRVVIVSQVLPSSSTVGDEQFSGVVVKAINNMPLKNLADVAAALQHPVDGFHKIELEEAPHLIFLDPKQIDADNETLMKNYGLPSLSKLK